MLSRIQRRHNEGIYRRKIEMKKSKNKVKKKKKTTRSHNVSKRLFSPTKDKGSSISVCLIVKNEERFLEKCLKSVKDIADEIIIIDTGSQDNTVAIAKKYTEKVFFHLWNDNYGEARNHYFDYAKGDWIFHIDADEELVKEDIPVLLKAVKDSDTDLVLIPIVSHLEKGQSEGLHNGERLFRNNGIIRYEGRIHERLVGYKNAKISPVHLIHYGYDLKDDDLSERKNQRRIRLLNMDIQDNPDNPLPYHYLSCCYLYRDLFDETLKAGIKAIELAEKNNNEDPIFLSTRYNVAMAYYELKDFKSAETIALSAITLDKRHLDSYYLLTAIYFDLSKWLDVIKYGKDYLNLCTQFKNNPEKFGTMVANSFGSLWKIQILMGVACNETGDTMQSKELFRSALQITSNRFNALKIIGTYHYNKALFSRSKEYLEKAFDLNKDDSSVNDMLEKIRSGKHSINNSALANDNDGFTKNGDESGLKEIPLSLSHQLSLYIEKHLPDKAMEIIRRHPEQVKVTGAILCQVAVLYLEKGIINEAIKCYLSAVEMNNNLFEAWSSLGEIMLAINKIEDSRVFFEKALSIRNNDITTILNLCDIAAINADIIKMVDYLNLLLKITGLPTNKMLNSLDDLQKVLEEIGSAFSNNIKYQNHIAAISDRISIFKSQST